MNPKIIIFLVLVLSGGILTVTLRADSCSYDSVEWLTCVADKIAVYHVERVYGPHTITNFEDGQHYGWSDGNYTTDFKLTKVLRDNPPISFSRSYCVNKPDETGFHNGDNDIFFFVADERLKNVRAQASSTKEAFFSQWYYIWLRTATRQQNWSGN
jgi:hypothetical protein